MTTVGTTVQNQTQTQTKTQTPPAQPTKAAETQPAPNGQPLSRPPSTPSDKDTFERTTPGSTAKPGATPPAAPKIDPPPAPPSVQSSRFRSTPDGIVVGARGGAQLDSAGGPGQTDGAAQPNAPTPLQTAEQNVRAPIATMVGAEQHPKYNGLDLHSDQAEARATADAARALDNALGGLSNAADRERMIADLQASGDLQKLTFEITREGGPDWSDTGKSPEFPSSMNDCLNSAVSSLSHAANLAGPQATSTIAGDIIAGMKPDESNGGSYFGGPGNYHNNAFRDAFQQAASSGAGIGLGFEIGSELQNVIGPPGDAGVAARMGDADRLYGALADGVHDLQQRFDQENSDVTRRSAELAQFQQDYGGALGPDGLKKAMDKFKSDHQAEFDAWQTDGAALAGELDDLDRIHNSKSLSSASNAGALKAAADSALLDAAQIGQTDAGQKKFADALATKGQDPAWHGWLDSALNLTASMGGRSQDALNALTTTMLNAAMFQATRSATNGGDLTPFRQSIDGIKAYASAFGLGGDTPEAQRSVAKVLDKIRGFQVRDPKQTAKWMAGIDQTLKEGNANLDRTSPWLANSFRALGLGLGAYGVLASGTKFADDQSLQNAGNLFLQSVGLARNIPGVDGLMEQAVDGALKFFQDGPKVWSLAKIGGIAPVLSSIVDVVGLGESLAQGDGIGAIGSGAQLIGTGLIGWGIASEAFPLVGTIAGSALVAAGSALSIYDAFFNQPPSQHDLAQSDLREFLGDGGMSSNMIDAVGRLGDNGTTWGSALDQIARDRGESTAKLMQDLGRSPDAMELLAGNLPGPGRPARGGYMPDPDRFWQQYQSLSPADRANWIRSVLEPALEGIGHLA